MPNPSIQDKYPLLSQIDTPADLRRVPLLQLPAVCSELRTFIVETLADHPGHLASSLGVVELTVALHYVYATPNDRIVWDVGHQAYGHKILTGRRDEFHTNRQFHGIKPFPSPSESEYDTFACGHASNSISAALGMATAASMHSQNDGALLRRVVAVIGDGAMSGGLAFEGLNNTSETPNDLLIVLNDNNMSIDRAVGGMKQYLHHLHTSSTYNRLRYQLAQKLSSWGFLNNERRRRILRFNNSLKSLLTNQQNIFEGMNIRYFGPSDGHDVVELVHSLYRIRDMKGPKLLHIHTTKGKGYEAAEKNPTVWHAPGKFDFETGERITTAAASAEVAVQPRFQDVFGETLLELARTNDKIVGITPAMPTGCSLNIMASEMPERTFDVGIAEGHAVTFSGGLAKEGMHPFCNIYSSFSQRAYDNLIHDVALLHLPVTLCLDRAGLVGEDGATHHGAFDMAAMRSIPGLTICSPYDAEELRHMMSASQQEGEGPWVIRYPRGKADVQNEDWHCPLTPCEVGKGRTLREGTDVAVVTIGPIGHHAARAIDMLQGEADAPSVAHFDLRFLKPLDESLLHDIGQRFSKIVTLEDGVRQGGMGSAVLEWMADHGYSPRVVRMGLPDNFVEHGTPAELYHLCGLDAEAIAAQIRQLIS